MSGWTIDQVLLRPKRAADLLNEYETLRMRSNKRINDLLNANNRYLEEGREARRERDALTLELKILRAGLRLRH
jgi:hypothetical protein